jgi:uncharacterized protein YvpB
MDRRKQLLTLVMAILMIGGMLSATRFIHSPAEVVAQTSPEERSIPSVTRSSTATLAPSRTPTRTPTPTVTVTSTPLPTRTFTPRPTRTANPTATLPVQVNIQGIYGFGQLLPLSCESRSAADWARHFKVDIREMEFMERVPKSDDPEVGFVGSPYGSWGQIPPNPYGVHAAPVAAVLRSYGLKAEAGRNLTWDFLRSEISAGRPVIVWVVGHVEPGASVQVEIGGATRTVARYEHTVIVTGYDAKYVTILDGKKVYHRPIEIFLASWQALENMAIFWNEDRKE